MPKSLPKILIASGVNLDLLGRREPEIYGHESLIDMQRLLEDYWTQSGMNKKFKLEFFQSNDEAKFLLELDNNWVGVVINGGAWTHTSLAIADRLVGLRLPYVEVHISDLSKREGFRQHSYLASHAIAVVDGQGIRSYLVGLERLLDYLGPKHLEISPIS